MIWSRMFYRRGTDKLREKRKNEKKEKQEEENHLIKREESCRER